MRLFICEHTCYLEELDQQTSISLADEGWAMLAAVLADFAKLSEVEVTTLLSMPTSAWAGRFHAHSEPELARVQMHYCSAVDRLECFDALSQAADAVLMIAPEFDGILLSGCHRVKGLGVGWVGCEPTTIELVSDKARLNMHWLAHGVPTPRLMSADCKGPCVAKPRTGAGSQATFFLPRAPTSHELYALAASVGWRGELIVQEYVSGTPASVSLLISPKQTIALMPSAQHIAKDGRFTYTGGTVPLVAHLRERASRLAHAAVGCIPGLRGYVGVDMVLGVAADGSQDYAIEINPRLTTSYVGLRRLCRTNLAECWLRMWRGETVAEPVWGVGVINFKSNGAWTEANP